MNLRSIELARNFASHSINAEEFEKLFFPIFREERDSGCLYLFNGNQIVTTIFCNLDCFNPYENREIHEIDEVILRKRVIFLLNALDNNLDIDKATDDVYLIN